MSSVIACLEGHVSRRGDALALRVLRDGHHGGSVEDVSFQQLAARAGTIARALELDRLRGRTVLLLYPTGSELVSVFLACLYAGAIAVPAYPPDTDRLSRTLRRVQAIAADSRAELVLTNQAIGDLKEELVAHAPGLRDLRWVATDPIATDERAERWPPPDPGHIAFLQYTSGSTGDPKGVAISHASLHYNVEMMDRAWPGGAEHRFVCWVPLYHDLGLVGNVLFALGIGARCTLLTPFQFLARPRSWLEAISAEQATIAKAPNFAYELCVRKVPGDQLDGLSLDSWRVALNGGEPTRVETMEKFAERFEPAGFKGMDAFHPSYGMSEATAFIASRGSGRSWRAVSVLKRELEQDRVVKSDAPGEETVRFASHGRTWLDQEVCVVDPVARRRIEPGRVGEIWVRGPSVAGAYWHRPGASEETFGARLHGAGDAPFLRTGDLGFVDDGDLFIAGRLKDLIILGGANYYPQDLEQTACAADARIRPGCAVAFAVDDGARERLVVVAEVYRRAASREEELAEVAEAVRREIFQEHEVPLDALVLISPRSIHKTSSGKVQRKLCRAAFLAGELDALYQWQSLRGSSADASPGEGGSERAPAGAGELVEFIRVWLSQSLGLDLASVSPHTPFADLGVDSGVGVELATELAERLGRAIRPTILWSFPTAHELAHKLAGGPEQKTSPDEVEDLESLAPEELESILAQELADGE